MICSNCGSPNTPGVRFCTACGACVGAATQVSVRRPYSWVWGLLPYVVICLILTVAFVCAMKYLFLPPAPSAPVETAKMTTERAKFMLSTARAQIAVKDYEGAFSTLKYVEQGVLPSTPEGGQAAQMLKQIENLVPYGNNAEALDLARAATSLLRYGFPGSKVAFHLELTPAMINGDIIAYRQSVTYCRAKIFLDDGAWHHVPSDGQRRFISTQLNTLHKQPVVSLELDYYPNSAGELAVIVDGRVVATGRYTKTITDIKLQQ